MNKKNLDEAIRNYLIDNVKLYSYVEKDVLNIELRIPVKNPQSGCGWSDPTYYIIDSTEIALSDLIERA